jgi:uncharacterized protein (TIGR03000 family)
MRRQILALFLTGLVTAVVAAPAQAQWRGGWGGWGGRGGWYGGSGWYGGRGFSYGSPYYGGYYGGWYRPYYGGYYSPYYSSTYAYPYTGYFYGSTYAPRMTTYDLSGTYAAAPQTQTYQANYYAPPSNDRVTLRVRVPSPSARVWVDNTLTDQQGTDRLYTSPTLQPGQQYHYTVRASWMENGREVTKEKVLNFSPGQQLTVDFTDTRDTSITDVTPPQGERPANLDQGTPGTATPAGQRSPGATPDRRPDQSTTGTPTQPPPPPKPPEEQPK